MRNGGQAANLDKTLSARSESESPNVDRRTLLDRASPDMSGRADLERRSIRPTESGSAPFIHPSVLSREQLAYGKRSTPGPLKPLSF